VATNSLNAAENPALANQLVQKMSQETAPEKELALVTHPSETVVTLPGGFLTPLGEVTREAEVRELNGRDEEAISKSNTLGKVLHTILSRGVVRIGDQPASEDILDQMFAGDRDALLLGIYKATFGSTADLTAFCSGCKDYKTLQIDIDDDIKVKKLSDPIGDRRFTVTTKKHDYTVVLPSGKVQKELTMNADKTIAELTTLLLEGTVIEIDGSGVISRNQIQNIGVADRREIAKALDKRAFGPVLDEVKAACPECGGEVVAPVNIGTLFRF
jgi:hypothetical protein